MAKSITEAAVDYAKVQAVEGVAKTQAMVSAFDPVMDSLKTMAKESDEAVDTFLANMPEKYNLELVPDKSRARLSTWLKDQKADYVELANEAGKYAHNTRNPKYVAAVEQMEKIKGGMNSVVEDMNTARELRRFEIENKTNRTSLTYKQSKQADDFILNDFVIEFTLDGAFYKNPVSGESMRVSKLKRSGVQDLGIGNAVLGVQTDAYNSGTKGVSRNLVLKSNKNSYAQVFSNKDAARQVAFLGMPGDNLEETRYIDHYVAEQAILGTAGFENIKIVDVNGDGRVDASDKQGGIYQFEDKTLVDAKIDQLKEDDSLDLSQNLVDFFTDMSMSQYDDGIAKRSAAAAASQGRSGGTPFRPDPKSFALKLQSGVPASLASITDNPAHAYQMITPARNKDNKIIPGKYDITDQKLVKLEGGKSLTLEQVSAYTGISVKVLSGIPEGSVVPGYLGATGLQLQQAAKLLEKYSQ
jgi:hypothetical protein